MTVGYRLNNTASKQVDRNLGWRRQTHAGSVECRFVAMRSRFDITYLLDPNPINGHERREHLDVVGLCSVVILFREDRHIRPAATHYWVVGSQIASKPSSWYTHDHAAPP